MYHDTNNILIVILTVQHEAGRAAFEDAQKQMNDIQGKISTKTASMKNVQKELQKKKLDALEARKVEQVCVLIVISSLRARLG